MHDHDNNNNEHLKGILGRMKPGAKAPDGDDSSEDLGKCGVVWPKGARALDVERGAEAVMTFQYVYLSVRSEFKPTEFKVLFVGHQSWLVTVQGRNLRQLYDRINDQCLRKIRSHDRDFGQDDGQPFVSKIEIHDVTPKEENAGT